MEMTFDGTLVMPSNFTVMNETEMTYLEGGGQNIFYKTVAKGCTYLSAMAAAFAGTGTGYAGAALAGASTIVLAVLAGAGSALCYSMASLYTSAYNSCSNIKTSYGSSKRVKITETDMFGAYISDVTCVVA